MKNYRTPIFLFAVASLGLCAALAGDGDTASSPPLGDARMSRAEGEKIAADLLSKWKEKTGRDWILDEKEAHSPLPPFDNSYLLVGEQGADHTYGRVTKEEIERWARETETLVAMGSRIFHDGSALGSTNAVSCDMCHPHGSNTHAETYPKFQAQAGRVFLLRDMINWCLMNPVRAKAWDADDPRMRAVEAYLYAQRMGKALAYGKH